MVTVVSQPLCQYLVVEESALIPMEQDRAASCLLLGIALALKAVKPAEKYPESTLIGGAGFVGLTLSAILPTTTPWVFGLSDQALMCARDLGASHTKEWEQAVEELEHQEVIDRGYAAILIETTGRQREREWSQYLTLKGGNVVCAVPHGAGGQELAIDATRFHYDQITWDFLPPCNAEEVVAAGAYLGRIPDTMITDQLTFADVEEAFEQLDNERAICYLMTDESSI